ncbi:hypothetical protein B0A55_12535 [Friedmanniomyces simplex]|uniref:DUF7730 domain-containing protein n=1 Tax=Friedmanniomyces simplex TaxID=329884 RepID=A0A4V5NCK7_9PEZI|nr:hypothetical protein B0A55_12535 [Friedmanniomyces simplex]
MHRADSPPARANAARAVANRESQGNRATRRRAAKATSATGPRRFVPLPAELRIRIYQLVFSPTITIVFRRKLPEPIQRYNSAKHWRCAAEPQSGPTSQVRYCDELPISKHIRATRRASQGHPVSLSGILFANQQIHTEAIAVLYEECNFFFERFRTARTFLRTMNKLNLESIRTLTFQLMTQVQGRAAKAKEAKEKADLGFANMCQQFVAALPKLKTLRLAVQLMEQPNHIVPDLADQGRSTFSVQQYEARFWLQAIKVFGEMEELSDVRIQFKTMSDSDLQAWFVFSSYISEVLPSTMGDAQYERVVVLFLRWHKSLHKSMGEVVRCLILGRPKEEAGKDHLVKLEQYRAYCYDPLGRVAETLESREYKELVLKYDKKTEGKKGDADMVEER